MGTTAIEALPGRDGGPPDDRDAWWANGGQGLKGADFRDDLREFSYVARAATAARSSIQRAEILPRVGCGSLWNEPISLRSRSRTRRRGGRWRMASPAAYAQICNAAHGGVHAAAGQNAAACGATAPRYNDATGLRPSIAPPLFLQEAKRRPPRLTPGRITRTTAGYVGDPDDAQCRLARDRLGDIDTPISQVMSLHGRKPL
jgi:hypothetical protein